MVIILFLSIISGILYRVAGKGGWKGAKLLRRIGCPFIFLLSLWYLKGFNFAFLWVYFALFILNALSMTTYWDGLSRLWRDNHSEHFENWLLTGFGYGLAALPLVFCDIALWMIIARSVFLAILIMVIRERTGDANLEEVGTGIVYNASIALLLWT